MLAEEAAEDLREGGASKREHMAQVCTSTVARRSAPCQVGMLSPWPAVSCSTFPRAKEDEPSVS